jgi:hypothetical protein
MRTCFFILYCLLTGAASAQNTGINTTTPHMALHVFKAADTALLQLDNGTSLANRTNLGMYFKNGTYYTGAIKTIGKSNNEARLGIFTFATNNQNNLKERLSILDNGNVGIGTI